MTRTKKPAVFGRFLVALALGVVLWGAVAAVFAPSSAIAKEQDLDTLKARWQKRYRDLRDEEARLVETVKLATKEYADSNRRNYRRSGVRHFHRTNANQAKAELAETRTKIAAMFDQVVAAGGSANWLYEVDDEPRNQPVQGLGVYEDNGRFGGKGAYGSAPEDQDEQAADAEARDDTDTGGRNPLYSGEDDAPAKFEEKGQETYDYDMWRFNRQEYEQERAPEKHLEPDSSTSDEES
jgi:hypothetical protein